MRFVASVLAAGAACVCAVPAEAAQFIVSGGGEGPGLSIFPPVNGVPFEIRRTTAFEFRLVYDTQIGCGARCVLASQGGSTLLTFAEGTSGAGTTLEILLNIPRSEIETAIGSISGTFNLENRGGGGFGFRANGNLTASVQQTANANPNFTYDAQALPEPATWAMMIAGFGLIGSTMRRRAPATA